MRTYYYNSEHSILSNESDNSEHTEEVTAVVASALLREQGKDFNWLVWNKTDLKR